MEKKPLNVLLVDDDEINRLVAFTFLKKWEVNVAIATDGKKALELIRTKQFDLVMMDLQMPEMDGYECTRRIRALAEPYFKNIPILVFSASSVIDSRRKAREFGMTDVMNKPFRQEELREKLSQYVTLPSQSLRPLKIDFSLHTDGEPVFKLELLKLLSENLAELNRAMEASLRSDDAGPFLDASHKVASAITILNEPELSSMIESLKQQFREANKSALPDNIPRLGRLMDDINCSMAQEIKQIQKILPPN